MKAKRQQASTKKIPLETATEMVSSQSFIGWRRHRSHCHRSHSEWKLRSHNWITGHFIGSTFPFRLQRDSNPGPPRYRCSAGEMYKNIWDKSTTDVLRSSRLYEQFISHAKSRGAWKTDFRFQWAPSTL